MQTQLLNNKDAELVEAKEKVFFQENLIMFPFLAFSCSLFTFSERVSSGIVVLVLKKKAEAYF